MGLASFPRWSHGRATNRSDNSSAYCSSQASTYNRYSTSTFNSYWKDLNLLTGYPQETISDVNYLYDIDKVTQEIINHILERQTNSNPGDEIAIANSDVKLKLMRKLNLAELRRVRRQYLSLTKQLYTTQARQHKQSLQELSEAFVNYLNTNLNQE